MHRPTKQQTKTSIDAEVDMLSRREPTADNAEHEAEAQKYPLADEVGIIHPKNKSAIMIRDTGVIDLMGVPHVGIRIDPKNSAVSTKADHIQNSGECWELLLQDSFVMETEKTIRTKTVDYVSIVRGACRTKAQQLWQVLCKNNIVSYAGTMWSTIKRQLILRVQEFLYVETPEVRLDTEIEKIAIQGHSLDDKVLYTQEMYDDIQSVRQYLIQLKTWADSHVHGTPAGPSTPAVAPSPMTPNLGVYASPKVRPWTGPPVSPIPRESQEDIDDLQRERWMHLQ